MVPMQHAPTRRQMMGEHARPGVKLVPVIAAHSTRDRVVQAPLATVQHAPAQSLGLQEVPAPWNAAPAPTHCGA
jgi:hypothetical protein